MFLMAILQEGGGVEPPLSLIARLAVGESIFGEIAGRDRNFGS
jgi:hypothetical protein